MAMRPGDRFTDERVRYIKQALIRGADVRAIARVEKCSLNTIRRIRDGETYLYVEVEGEEALRRPINVTGYQPPGQQLVNAQGLEIPVVLLPDVEVEAMAQRLMTGRPRPQGTTEGVAEGLSEEEVREKARAFGAG